MRLQRAVRRRLQRIVPSGRSDGQTGPATLVPNLQQTLVPWVELPDSSEAQAAAETRKKPTEILGELLLVSQFFRRFSRWPLGRADRI
ncbi:hypothetical protein [Curtobacterium sp. MCBD17_013]|uniref:hypothetical protein n=1 Tax=Curtobacterium sp. MCBD17_013 TaxID=2175668 RepID=UPI0011B7963A|nr:hypothetical protein [Curtobacterium sp. MCBD17_013]